MTTKTSLLFVAGLGSTGSSAVCDLLSGYNKVFCPSQEWRLWVDPDGLIDLAKHLSFDSSLFWHTTALERFTSLIRNLTGFSLGPYSRLNLPKYVKDLYLKIHRDILSAFECEPYHGMWYGNSNYLLTVANFRFNRRFWKGKAINKRMWLADIAPEKEVLRKIGSIVDKALEEYLIAENAELFAINENFSILFSSSILAMHPSAKIVVVLRDPLDVYADSLRVGWLAMPYDIQKFIRWQNRMYTQVEKALQDYPDRIHIVWFEELCTNFHEEVDRLKDFIPGVLSDPVQERFNPEKSIKNVGQWRKTLPWLEDYRNCFEIDVLR